MRNWASVVIVWTCAVLAVATCARGDDALRVTAADIGGGLVLVSWEDAGAGVRYTVERNPPLPGGGVSVEGRRFFLDACGEGVYSYRVQRPEGVQDRRGPESSWVRVVVVSRREVGRRAGEILRGVTIGGDGWAELAPTVDSRSVYVSSSGGDDRNDGLSPESPKRTIRAGYGLLRDGHPDWLLLRSGDTWAEGELWWGKSGRSPSERMVVTSYGDGPRPRWLTGTGSGIRGDTKGRGMLSNLVYRDLHLVQHENRGESGGAGFMLLNGWRDVLIENCRVERYRVNICLQAYTTGVRLSGIAIRRCIIVDALATNEAHAQGIFAEGVDGLLMEENVLDRNGWGPQTPTANMFRHNAYIQTIVGDDRGCTNIVTRGNISARASATGFMQRPGGIVEGNLLLQNPIAVQFGYRGGPVVMDGAVRGNVVIDGRDIGPGEPRAFGIWLTNVDGATVEENIIARQRTGTHNAVALNVDGVYRGVKVRRNIVRDWADPDGGGAALTWHGSPGGEIEVAENRFEQVRAGGLVGHDGATEGFVYRDNRYIAARAGPDEFWPGVSYAQWLEQSAERGSTFTPAGDEPDDDLISAYMRHTGMQGGIDDFLSAAREQSRGRWREELTAGAVIAFVRARLGASAGVADRRDEGEFIGK